MVAAVGGCVGPLFGDGTSVSLGTSNAGALRRGALLPRAGDGYVVPPRWVTRGSSYGTDELVDSLVRSARAVGREAPGGTLGIADLSPRGGGATIKHKSHENGRDVDLIYYAVDARGRPLRPADAMVKYAADGVSLPWRREHPEDPAPQRGWEPTARRFDVERNWALVKALLEDPEVEVQWIFIAEPLRAKLLEHAVQKGEAPELVERAEWMLHRPTDSQPHDDHMHVRVLCDAADRIFGCVDRGPVRWWKKMYKYMAPGWSRLQSRSMPDLLAGLQVGSTLLR
jgi:penicillin-insensitive murein DD-endopeptidase